MRTKITFGGMYRNADESAIQGFSAGLADGYINEFGALCRRPGLLEWGDVGTGAPIDGLYYWKTQECVIAVSDGKIYKAATVSGTFDNVTGDALETGGRPTFADYGDSLYIANGGQIVKLGTSGTTAYLTDVDAPTTVTHVGILDTYLLANNTDTGQLWYSAVMDPDTWEGDYGTAEAKPDDVTGLYIDGAEINLLGAETIEVWRNDGATPFVPNTNAITRRGVVAPYSFVIADGFRYCLDQGRRFVRIESRTPIEVSQAVASYIQGFDTVTDCMADEIVVDGKPWIILHFPTEGKTLAYNYRATAGHEWSRWGYWDGEYKRWLGNCFAYVDDWNLSLVGDYRTGKIYKMSSSYYDDDGQTIRTCMRTAHIDHGTLAYKRSSEMLFKLKRTAYTGTQDYLLLRWRDNGQTHWSNEQRISLKRMGDVDYIGRLTRLGRYRTRQYEVVLSDATALSLVSAEETVS
jgi:hypothetical protein